MLNSVALKLVSSEVSKHNLWWDSTRWFFYTFSTFELKYNNINLNNNKAIWNIHMSINSLLSFTGDHFSFSSFPSIKWRSEFLAASIVCTASNMATNSNFWEGDKSLFIKHWNTCKAGLTSKVNETLLGFLLSIIFQVQHKDVYHKW